ncbi:MAG: hypothetical protein WCY88_05135 [Spongiibacteraceae bacterium]
MSSAFLEIVQLPTGEIVLQRSDHEGEPLLNIQFSKESQIFLEGAELDIAKVMIQAGIQAAAEYSELRASEELQEPTEEVREHTLH